MRTHSPLFLLAALGVLATAGAQAAEVDTSQWKCEKCPYTKGTTGSIGVGAGYTSDDAATFGNFTGLQKKGGHLMLDGQLAHRGEGGIYADLSAAELGLDTRAIDARMGREGLFSLWLGYAQIPRYFAEGARTPFLGNGGSVLTLPTQPPGFPAADTASMPLADTLQPVELGYDNRSVELGAKWVSVPNWTYRASVRRDVRDGTRPGAGSFFSTASQLAVPVDQTNDQLELAASYASAKWQASLAYQLSQFKNGNPSLTWANPFLPVGAGATQGQIALAPDNQFHQLVGSVGYQISSTLRASADLAYGQGTQDAAYLPSTANTVLASSLAGLPAASLDGQVTTFNFNAKLTAAPMDGLRLTATYARDQRDNETSILAYPQVATDIFVVASRSNTPFDLTQDRFKLSADYRGPGSLKLSGGLDWDQRERNFQEAVRTRETTVWGRASVQALEGLGLTFNLAWADRTSPTYGATYWFGSTQNPLMRKVNLAARERASAGARADWAVSDAVSVGLGVHWANDDYKKTVIGLNEAETVSVNADITFVPSDGTRLSIFAQGEQVKSRQTGSQLFAAPDWTGKVDDESSVFGFSVKHAAIPDKLELGADLSIARSRSETSVQTTLADPAFPLAKTNRDTVKLYASYKLSDKVTLNGSYWYEMVDTSDWRLDGVQPATVFNLLAFGNQAPRYTVNVVRLSVRYQF